MSPNLSKAYRFTLPKAWKHLKLVFRHRFAVCRCCWISGLYWQGMVHDLSKFSPTEFIESVRFYTGVRSPVDTARDVTGYSAAWLHHKGRNRHHYEYWLDGLDHKGTPVKMPFRYALEMVCDYIAAGKTYTGKDWTRETPLIYWNKKKLTANIHPDTAAFLDYALSEIAVQGLAALPALKHQKKDYESL